MRKINFNQTTTTLPEIIRELDKSPDIAELKPLPSEFLKTEVNTPYYTGPNPPEEFKKFPERIALNHRGIWYAITPNVGQVFSVDDQLMKFDGNTFVPLLSGRDVSASGALKNKVTLETTDNLRNLPEQSDAGHVMFYVSDDKSDRALVLFDGEKWVRAEIGNEVPKVYDVAIYGSGLAAAVAAKICKDNGLTCAVLEPQEERGGQIATAGAQLTEPKAPNLRTAAAQGAVTELLNYLDKRDAATKFPKTLPIFNQADFSTLYQQWMEENSDKIISGNLRKSSSISFTAGNNKRIEGLIVNGSDKINADFYIDASNDAALLNKLNIVSTDREAKSAEEPLAGFRLNEALKVKGLAGLAALPDKPALAQGAADSAITMLTFNIILTTGDDKKTIEKPAGFVALPPYITAAITKQASDSLVKVLGEPIITDGDKVTFQPDSGLIAALCEADSGKKYLEASLGDQKKLTEKLALIFKSLLWSLQNDAALPEALRNDAKRYGMAAGMDWPLAPVIKETARLKGAYVLNQADLFEPKGANTRGNVKADKIAQWQAPYDFGACRYFKEPNQSDNTKATLFIEGDLTIADNQQPGVFDIPYSCLHTKPDATDHIENVLAPVAISATHVASRVLNHELLHALCARAAAHAIVVAKAENINDLSQVPVDKLQARLTTPEPVEA